MWGTLYLGFHTEIPIKGENNQSSETHCFLGEGGGVWGYATQETLYNLGSRRLLQAFWGQRRLVPELLQHVEVSLVWNLRGEWIKLEGGNMYPLCCMKPDTYMWYCIPFKEQERMLNMIMKRSFKVHSQFITVLRLSCGLCIGTCGNVWRNCDTIIP